MLVLARPRKLLLNERDVLRALVREVDAPSEVLACQAEHALVIEECVIGCGTVILAVDEGACPDVRLARGAPATADGNNPNGLPVSVLLHFRDGYVRMLEVVNWGDRPGSGMPPISILRAYGDGSPSPWKE